MTATAPVGEKRGGGEFIPGWREDEHPLHDKLDRDLLVRAYQFGEQAHRGQVRNSGEPFISHAVEVAKILADLQLDSTTVACGLLHDVVEDTKVAIADVDREFGREIASIVDGLTKIAKLPSGGSTQDRQVESYRKLLLSIAKDARVIIVKLADRLHNMRTLDY
ncbi:MAG TPA: HD domain-containing protein, partial [Gemmatimonadaceae bacterium]|nr:HD domain-containing protein [Gemmatimonadaceae bacterium]